MHSLVALKRKSTTKIAHMKGRVVSARSQDWTFVARTISIVGLLTLDAPCT